MTGSQRLGLIVPSSNTVAERDFRALMPPGVDVHTARMYLAETTAAAERKMLEVHAPQAAEDLGSANPDVVVFSCTSAGALLGIDGEQLLERQLGELSRTPIVSTNASVAWRLASIGARRLAVLTAYIDELNREIRATLEQRGFEVARIAGMGITDNFAIASVSPQEIVDFAEDAARGLEVDAIFVSCTNLRAVEAVDELSRRLGIPVVTSNLSAAEAALARLGRPGTGIGEP